MGANRKFASHHKGKRMPMIDNIPVQQIRDEIEALETVDLSVVSDDKLRVCVQQLMKGYAWRTKKVEMKAAYRARRPGEKYRCVKQLWYPPPQIVKKMGRANARGESVFYCASCQDTAILEMRPQIGEELVVLQVGLKDANVWPHVFEIGVPELAAKHDPKVGINRFHRTDIGQNFLGSRKNAKKIQLIRDFLVRQFTKVVPEGKEYEYALSLAIAKTHRDKHIDGLWYPSISCDNKGTNLAIKASAADRLFKPYGCWIIEILEEQARNTYLVECKARAREIMGDGTIVW